MLENPGSIPRPLFHFLTRLTQKHLDHQVLFGVLYLLEENMLRFVEESKKSKKNVGGLECNVYRFDTQEEQSDHPQGL
jgi:hypothetical protein